MSHKKIDKNPEPHAPNLIPVHFRFNHPTAATVYVAGAFNQWRPEVNALQPAGNGHWLKEMALPVGTYEYCLVVDGQWMPDPVARDFVPNPYGGMNSVLHVRHHA